jgi:hypothetical protein
MMSNMKAAACFLIALFLLSVAPVIARCDDTFINAELFLTQDNASKSWVGTLNNGDHISISLTVNGYGKINFHILNSHDVQLLDETNIGTEGWQGQWTVPYDDDIEFVVELTTADQAVVGVRVTLTGTDGGTQQQGGNGGFDPTPIAIIVIVLLAMLISIFFIFRLRKQPPPPPPTEEPPPPPP